MNLIKGKVITILAILFCFCLMLMSCNFGDIIKIKSGGSSANSNNRNTVSSKSNYGLGIDEGGKKSHAFRTRNTGSAKMLAGKCLFVNVFISDAESFFTENEKDEVMKQQKEAEDFMKANAQKYGIQLSMIDNTEEMSVDIAAKHTISPNTSFSIEDIEFFSEVIEDCDKKINFEKYQAENVFYLFNIDKTGRSYARPNDKVDGFILNQLEEFAVCYTSDLEDEDELVDTYPGVYVHEILHLFGAIDLYDLDDERLKLAEKYFPDDIMLTIYRELDLCRIDGLTAFLVGWTDELAEKYKTFLN